jgi:hypothetical protein
VSPRSPGNQQPRESEPPRPELPPRPEAPAESSAPAFTHRDPGTPVGSGAAPEQQEQEQAGQDAPAELMEARGPFEPLQHPDGSDQRLISYLSAGYEPSSAKPIDQIKDFYLTAEAVDPEHLDGHIEQLLERQRQLIGEYFKQAGVPENPQ